MQTPPFGVPAGTSPESTYEALRKDVATRLRNVCAGWSDADFEAIVEKVTRTALKYVQPEMSGRRSQSDTIDPKETQA
jgi:hypothetical protein